MSLVKKLNQVLSKSKDAPMQLSDALQIAERIIADAEVQSFNNTAEAMRQVLNEMARIECASRATFSAAELLPLS